MPGEVPSGWSTARLGEVASFQKGRSIDLLEECLHGAQPYIGAAEFAGPPSRWTTSGEAVLCRPEDVLMLWDGERSGLSATGLAGAVASTVVRLRPSSQRILPNYLYFSLHARYRWIQQRRTGSGIPHVPKDLSELVRLILPPLPEQKKIAAILSSVDEAIQATQAVIDQTRRVKEGLLQDLLTRGLPGHTRFKQTEIGEIPESWEVRRLQEVCRENITYGIVQCGPHVDGGVPYIRVSDMGMPELQLEGMLRTSTEIARKFSRSAVERGDIVYALRGKIGEVRVVRKELVGANLTQGTARLSPSPGIASEFLMWAMRSPTTMKQGELAAKGSTFREVTLDGLRKLRIPVPPRAEQDGIVARLWSADHAERDVQASLSALGRLKTGLLQDLLSGRVRVSP